MAATVTVPSSALSLTRPRAASAPTTGTTTLSRATAAAGRRTAPVPRRSTTSRTTSYMPKPHSTTAKPSTGVPPTAASGRNTPSACPNAILPQGKPWNGARARAASPAIHTAAAHTGAPGSFETAAIPTPTRAMKIASIATSASQGPGPTSTPVHTSSGSRKPRPKR